MELPKGVRRLHGSVRGAAKVARSGALRRESVSASTLCSDDKRAAVKRHSYLAVRHMFSRVGTICSARQFKEILKGRSVVTQDANSMVCEDVFPRRRGKADREELPK